jgi:two-component system, NarL family, invasion response regulator UvrY
VPATTPDPVRVLVVDDHEVARGALCDVVGATPGFELVGEASSGPEALELVISVTAPQLVLLDVQMPGMDGVETARRIGRLGRDVTVVLLSAQCFGPAFERGSLSVLYKGDVTPGWLTGLWARHAGSSN